MKHLFVRLKSVTSAKNVSIAVQVNLNVQSIGALKMTDMKNTSVKTAEIASIITKCANPAMMQVN